MSKNSKKTAKGSTKDNKKKLEAMNGDPSVLVSDSENMTVEDAIKEITSPENVDNLEKELKDEYGISDASKDDETVRERQEELETVISEVEGLSEEVDTLTNLNEIAKLTDPKEIEKALSERLDQIEEKEKTIDKRMKDAERKLEQASRNMKNKRYTDFWGGVRYT